jgi:hypothetical protein
MVWVQVSREDEVLCQRVMVQMFRDTFCDGRTGVIGVENRFPMPVPVSRLEQGKIQRRESHEEDQGNLSEGKWIFCFVFTHSNNMRSVHSPVPGCSGQS